MNFLLNKFISKEKRSTKSQLIKDFGVLPNEIQTEKILEKDFQIICLKSRIAELIFFPLLYIYLTPELFRDFKRHINKNNQPKKSITSFKKNILEITNEFENEILGEFKKYKKEKRWIRWLLHIPYSLILSILFLIFLVFVFLFGIALLAIFIFYMAFALLVIFSKSLPKADAGGLYRPAIPDFVFVLSKSSDAEATISHEHIHFLQNKLEHDDCLYKKSDINIIKNLLMNLNSNLSGKIISDNRMLTHFQYLLEREEIEARLHEILISYYKQHGSLPKNAFDFILMFINISTVAREYMLLHTCEMIERLQSLKNQNKEEDYQTNLIENIFGNSYPAINIFTVFLSEVEKIKRNSSEINSQKKFIFEPRAKYAIDDIEYLISILSENNVLFITEILPYLYGNLLGYYGFEEGKAALHDEINKTKFYFDLFPLEAKV